MATRYSDEGRDAEPSNPADCGRPFGSLASLQVIPFLACFEKGPLDGTQERFVAIGVDRVILGM